MMANVLVVPGLAGSTSAVLTVAGSDAGESRYATSPLAWSAGTQPKAAADGQRPARTVVLSRLAELREQAAARQRSMPTYPDEADDSDDAAERAAMQQLQMKSSAWSEED